MIVATFLTSSTLVFAGGMEDRGSHHPKPNYAADIGATPTNNYAVRKGQWSVAARTGIAPTFLSRKIRATGTIVNITGGPVTVPGGSYSIFNSPFVYRDSRKFKWSNLYDMPFTAGGDITYGVMDNLEIVLNFDYNYAASEVRKYTPVNYLGRTFTFKSKPKNFNSYAGYVGGRLYVDIDSFVTPFIGAKLGFVHRAQSKLVIKNVTSGSAQIFTINVPFFKSSTGFSGGLQLGFDYRLSDAFSLVLMGEAIGSSGVKYNKGFNNIYTRPGVLKAFSRITRTAKTTLTFPITAGVKVRL